jgi:inorganic pyrophosphatase
MANIDLLGRNFMKHTPNPQHVLTPFDEDGNINMLVEIPQGSFNKYEYVTEAGIIKLDRVLYEMLPYPIEYGLIPQTYDEDDDLLDIMCIMSYPTFPGCLVAARPIGVMYMNDSGERDDKILAVPADDIRFKHIKTLNDIPQIRRDEIQFFWEHYKDLQFKHKGQHDKKIVIEGWGDENDAKKVIEKCMVAYNEKFRKTENPLELQ